jgi:hypothetical protein
MKHFIELDRPDATYIHSHLPSLAAANATARAFVLTTRRTATTYSHNKAGHAIHRRAFELNANGKLETRRF